MNTFRFNIADDVVCIWRNVLGNMYVKRAVIKWLSRTVFKTSSNDVKRMFRDLEKLNLKLVSLESHRTFNETCINNDLLPTYTNIDIYVYIFLVNSWLNLPLCWVKEDDSNDTVILFHFPSPHNLRGGRIGWR